MENLNRVASYLSLVLNQARGVRDMSSPPSTSSGCVSRASEDDGSDPMEKSIESSTSVSAETYLSLPEEVLTLTSASELEQAISHCKSLVLDRPDDSEEKKWLVRRLIELRLRLEDVKDMKEIGLVTTTSKVLLGHHFHLHNSPTAKHYCDRCSGIIWNVIHSWYSCVDCDYKCHVQCLNQVCRICAHVQVAEKPEYIPDICPESQNGLADQNYRCAECLTHTSFRDSVLEPRLCDYNGKYYCPTCHWNSTCVIPARVVYNWDFREKRVCRASKQMLKLMSKMPILRLEQLNPVLFATVEELTQVKMVRQRLLTMKKYLTSCKAALESHLLWHLDERLHLIESEDTYSIQDLLDLRSGELVPYLDKLGASFSKHIKQDCKVCHGRGYCCELCKLEEVIFPFEENVVTCGQCQAAYHFPCWVKANQQCPKCERLKLMKLKRSETEEEVPTSASTNPFDSES